MFAAGTTNWDGSTSAAIVSSGGADGGAYANLPAGESVVLTLRNLIPGRQYGVRYFAKAASANSKLRVTVQFYAENSSGAMAWLVSSDVAYDRLRGSSGATYYYPPYQTWGAGPHYVRFALPRWALAARLTFTANTDAVALDDFSIEPWVLGECQ